MSITSSGPAGYSYQDDVTVWLALAVREAAPFQATADSGQEDATFTLTVDSASRTLEVQMKSGRDPVDEARFADWLAHFPEDESEGSLLEQLRTRADLNALFVVTASCTDVVAGLMIARPEEALRPRSTRTSPLLVKHGRALLDAYSRAHEHPRRQSTALEAARDARCKLIARAIDTDELREIARRIFIIPHMDQQAVRAAASLILNQAFLVPQGETGIALDALAKVVRDASRTARDIIAPLLERATESGKSLLLAPSKPNVPRPSEDALLDALERRHVLLLTGLPNAGKTHTARVLASRYQRQGYNACEEINVGAAGRFLHTPGPEERIVLLEDPFGRPNQSQDAHQALAAVRDLVADAARHRKLIVTSRADILGSLLGAGPWQIDGHPFHDLSVVDAAFASSIWEQHARHNKIDEDAIARVRSLLLRQGRDELLQPGQVRHLARNFQGDTDEVWKRIARQDGRELGRALEAERATRDVLAALRMLASTTLPVSLQELFFVLSGGEARPGRDVNKGQTLTLAGKLEIVAPKFPEYGRRYDGSREEREALETLERRGLIEQLDDGYRFSHLTYVEAAEQALRNARGAYSRRLVEMFERALFCLRPRNAAHATEALALLEEAARTDKERRELLALAFAAFKTSIFPAVRDRCSIWLLRRRDRLDKDQHRSLLHVLRHNKEDGARVVWRYGEAWLDQREHISATDPHVAEGLFRQLGVAPDEAGRALESAQAGRLLPEFLWSLLYQQAPEDVEPGVLERAFVYEETFVRALAANITMMCHPERVDLVRLVLRDEHPQVFASGLQGLLSRWTDRQDVRNSRLEEFITAEITPERATVILALLESFERVGGWYCGVQPPARQWALLAARALPNVPSSHRVDTSHLHYYATRLLPEVSITLAESVLQGWLDLALRALRESAPESVYDLCALWMTLTRNDSSLRSGLVGKLLRLEDTQTFVTATLAFVASWDKLDAAERSLVCEALVGARVDARWARAFVLTCLDPPREIVALLLGSGDALQRVLVRRLEPLDRSLISDGLRVCEDLGGAANCSPTRAFWRLVVRLSAEPEHPLFERALRLCLDERGGGLGADRWIRYVWLKLCCNADDRRREILFTHLLEKAATANYGHFQGLWRVLLAATSDDIVEGWARRINPYIESLDDYNNLAMLLSDRRIGPMILARLPLDCSWFRHHKPLSLQEKRRLAETLYSGGAPRLRRTHANVLEEIGAAEHLAAGPNPNPDPVVERVIAARVAGIELAHSRREALIIARSQTIDDWMWLFERRVGAGEVDPGGGDDSADGRDSPR